MPLDDFETPAAWRQDLDSRWPERLEMKAVVLTALRGHLTGFSRPAKVLELGVGDGELLQQVATSEPTAHLAAADINPRLLAYSRDRMDDNRVEFVEQDLRQSWSADLREDWDLVYTLQSLHDLGGRDALTDVYAKIAQSIAPGGMLLNADFVVPMPHDDPAAPRRFPADVHVEILHGCGFIDAKPIAQFGQLGCIAARWPGA